MLPAVGSLYLERVENCQMRRRSAVCLAECHLLTPPPEASNWNKQRNSRIHTEQGSYFWMKGCGLSKRSGTSKSCVLVRRHGQTMHDRARRCGQERRCDLRKCGQVRRCGQLRRCGQHHCLQLLGLLSSLAVLTERRLSVGIVFAFPEFLKITRHNQKIN